MTGWERDFRSKKMSRRSRSPLSHHSACSAAWFPPSLVSFASASSKTHIFRVQIFTPLMRDPPLTAFHRTFLGALEFAINTAFDEMRPHSHPRHQIPPANTESLQTKLGWMMASKECSVSARGLTLFLSVRWWHGGPLVEATIERLSLGR